MTSMADHLPRIKRRLFDTAAGFGLAGHRDYTRFILLGRGRSGSNFLASSLASHPNVVAFGELFNNVALEAGRVGWAYPGYRNDNASEVQLRHRDPRRFIDETVFSPMPAAVQAVGFKLFYFHARDEATASVWPHLADLGVHVVHLKRRNLLASLVSGEIAKETMQWASRSTEGGSDDRAPIELDPEVCREYFEKTVEHQDTYSDYFGPTLDIYYEDLVEDYAGITREVQQHLGVPALDLSSPLKQQSRSPLSERIANYDQLAQHFENTRWSEFFDA